MYDAQATANLIKKIAKEKNILIKDMLQECALSKNAISTMLSRGSWLQANNLAKIADYLDCSIDYLLGRIDNVQGEGFSAKEKKLVTAYRSKPEMQGAVDKLLGVDELTFVESGKIAAFGSGPKDATLSTEALKDIDNLPDA